MKYTIHIFAILLIASAVSATDVPPVENGCYKHVGQPPASCDGGEIVQDQYAGCRTVVCTDNVSSLSVLACSKPDNVPVNQKEFFEMYKLFEVGPSQLEICLGETCLSNSGFAKSDQYPLCPDEPQDPFCGDGILNQENEQCDGLAGVGQNQRCTQECTILNLTYCGDGIVQEPNDKGMYEECDGSAPDGYECTNKCEVRNNACVDSICELPVECDGEVTELSCRSCRTLVCAGEDGNSTILACEKPNEPPAQYFEMYLIGQEGNGPAVCIGETCLNPKYSGFARSSEQEFICDEQQPLCGDGNLDDGEQCDDGNLNNSNGCDEFCQFEDPLLTVIKVVVNDNGGNGTVADWDLMVNNTIVDNGTPNDFAPGNYIVHELLTAPLEAGYLASFSGDCDENGSVTLDWNDDKVCVITNDDIGDEEPGPNGSITILKNVDDDAFVNLSFDFTSPLGNFSISENSDGFFMGGLPAGNYPVQEIVPADWDLVSINCGPNDNTGLANGLTIVLEEGEQEICTFNNEHLESCEIDHRTQTQGGWGQGASGNNPGTYRDANFAGAFPSGALIGNSDSRFALYTTAAAVEGFLPAGGPSAALTVNSTDSSTPGGGNLAGQTLALTLSLGFDAFDANFSESDTPLAELVLDDGDCAGMTVQEVLDEANTVLAGQASSFTASELNDCAALVNENFVDGTTDEGNLICPETLVQ